MAVYDRNGVFIDSHTLRFGTYTLPTRHSNAGPIYLDGLHDVRVREEGFLSTKYRVVLVFFDDKPDQIVWTASSSHEAQEIANAIREVLL